MTYSLCKNIRSHFSLDILSYMHDIAIPTKDLSSAWSELQLWFFAPNDLFPTSVSTQRQHTEKLHFLYPCPHNNTGFAVLWWFKGSFCQILFIMESPIEKQKNTQEKILRWDTLFLTLHNQSSMMYASRL